MAQGTCATTESLACGEVKARSIDVASETDCFTFHAETNEAVSVLTKATAGSSIQACWQLQDANGDAVGGAVCGQGQRIVPAPGVYTVKVFDGGNDQTGGYRASLTVLSASASSCPVSTLPCGTAATGVILVPTESHTYSFEAAEAGEVVSITTADTSAVIQACWRLFAPDGSAVGASVCGQADRTLANVGTYTIQVAEQNDDGTGAYQVQVDVLSPIAASCPEGTLETCQPLSRGIAAVGDNDVYRIVTAQPNTALKITTTTTSGAMNACWQLYTSAGALFGSTVCGSDERAIPTAGTYSLRVFDQGHDGTGTYLIATETLAGCPTPTPIPTITPSSTATATTGGTPGGDATPTATVTNGAGGGTATPDDSETPAATATPAVAATATSGAASPTSALPTPVATQTAVVPVPTPTGLPLAEATLDEFLCYSTVTTKGTAKFVSLRGVVLPDAIDQGHFDIRSPNELCSPADREGAAIIDPSIHLERYQLTRWRGEAPYRRVTRRTTTALGSVSLDATRPVALLVPSAENAIVPPAVPSASEVGSYKCYKVKVTPKTAKFPKDARLRLTDGLSAPGRGFSVKRPKHLCLATGLNGPVSASPPLVCYTVRLSKGEPRHVRKGGLFVANELRSGRLNTRREAELCLPAVLEP